MTEPAVDILVVNFNTKDKLQRLIDTLTEDDNGLWNLYIADNGSQDGSIDLLKNSTEKRIAGVDHNENIGYARAINQMAMATSSRYLVAMNGDAWMSSGDVEKMVDFLDANPSVGASGPKQRDETGRITHAGIFGSHVKPAHRGWLNKDGNDTLFRDIKECVTLSGSVLFFRRDTWNKLRDCPIYQGFHEDLLGDAPWGAMPNFPHYYEETLAMYHLSAHPEYGKVVYNGTVSVGHSWHSSSKKGDPYTSNGFKVGQKLFREFCERHKIPHD